MSDKHEEETVAEWLETLTFNHLPSTTVCSYSIHLIYLCEQLAN